jgi:DNA-binding XRE family transcriptional regulator
VKWTSLVRVPGPVGTGFTTETTMGTKKWSELRDRTFTKKELVNVRAETVAEVLDMNLRAVREMVGKTQVELAKTAGLSQGELSEQERREDHLLSTLRRYIEALGGELEVIARIGDKTVRLRGV